MLYFCGERKSHVSASAIFINALLYSLGEVVRTGVITSALQI